MANAEQTITRASVGLRSDRGPILLAVMLATGLVAIDSTILATAVPSVVGDLGGFSQFPWLFSVYLLTQAISVPLYGKIADIWGRKPVMMVGIGLFLLGSLLCGVAWGMVPLIAFRALQGLGAGAVQPMGMTIMGDIYTLKERAKAQGYIASVWAISAVVGPTLGGVFSDYASWRWIFFVNLPIGLLAAWMLVRCFHETVHHREHRIDYLGSFLLTLGGVLLLLALIEGGVQWAWDAPVSIALFAIAVVSLAGFAYVESRTPEPVLPLWVFGRRVLNASNLGSLVVGAVMLGLSSYVPTFAQGVLGHGAVVAGLALAGMTIGWPIAASQSGRIYLTRGFRFTTTMGAVITVIGGLLLLTVNADSSIWHLAFPCFVMGLGFGFVASPGIVAAQSSVGWETRGVATGANMFARSVGSSVGVAVYGAIANGVLARRLGGDAPSDLTRVSPDVLEPAIHDVFIAAVLTSILLVVAGVVMQRTVLEPGTATRQ
jgi:EmrB/QacA subfamily drug resistance transporter